MNARKRNFGPAVGRLAVLVATAMFLAGALSTASALASSHGKRGSKVKLSSRQGAFVPVKQMMSSPRFDAVDLSLPDGKVLIAGGQMSYGHGGPYASDSADVFDPSTGKLEISGQLAGPRGYGRGALLADGRVLLIGGNFCCYGDTPQAEIYDPGSGTSQPLELSQEVLFGDAIRFLPTIAPLPSGEILVAGGGGDGNRRSAILDPETGQLTYIDDMPVGRTSGRAATLPDGRILIYGGMTDFQEPQFQSVIFDPSDRSFRLLPKDGIDRVYPATAVLDDGRVLFVGGRDPDLLIPSKDPSKVWKSAEIFDPATGRFEMTGRPIIRRIGGMATQMSDGRVLVTGGSGWIRRGSKIHYGETRVSEIYDPETGKFTRTGDLEKTRRDASIVALPNGRVLLAGGVSGEWPRRSAEVFKPWKFNPRVKILKVAPRRQTIKAKRTFRFFVHLRNLGKGVARDVRVCPGRVPRNLKALDCPAEADLKPAQSRWVVVKGSFRARNELPPHRPLNPGKRRFELLVRGPGVNLYAPVVVKVRR